MIPAYDEKKAFQFGYDRDCLADHIKRTTKASNPYTVYCYIKDYLHRNPCDDDVTSFLKAYVRDFRNLLKTHIVSDGSFRNCCILVRPDGLIVTHSGGYGEAHGWNYTWRDILPYFRENAERIFLNMTDETWEEQR